MTVWETQRTMTFWDTQKRQQFEKPKSYVSSDSPGNNDSLRNPKATSVWETDYMTVQET